jgi:hypothetical protein
MRRLSEELLKGSQEMIGRKTGHARYIIQCERLVEGGGDEIPGPIEPSIKFFPCRGAQGGQGLDLVLEAAMNLQKAFKNPMQPLINPQLIVASLRQRVFQCEEVRRHQFVMTIGSLEKIDRRKRCVLWIIEKTMRRNGQTPVNILNKSILEKQAEGLERRIYINSDFVRLVLIQNQVGVRRDSITSCADIVYRFAALKGFDRKAAHTLPMMLRFVALNNEARPTERVRSAIC